MIRVRLSVIREIGALYSLSLMNMDDPAGRSMHAKDLKWLAARYPKPTSFRYGARSCAAKYVAFVMKSPEMDIPRFRDLWKKGR
jgi:hypothetical protein